MRINNTQRELVKTFIEKVMINYSERNGGNMDPYKIEVHFQLALEDEFFKYECPDCIYSIKKGHQI